MCETILSAFVGKEVYETRAAESDRIWSARAMTHYHKCLVESKAPNRNPPGVEGPSVTPSFPSVAFERVAIGAMIALAGAVVYGVICGCKTDALIKNIDNNIAILAKK
jgi:hypothetical protein